MTLVLDAPTATVMPGITMSDFSDTVATAKGIPGMCGTYVFGYTRVATGVSAADLVTYNAGG